MCHNQKGGVPDKDQFCSFIDRFTVDPNLYVTRFNRFSIPFFHTVSSRDDELGSHQCSSTKIGGFFSALH